jgi:serine protease
LNLGTVLSSAQLSLRNSGPGSITVDAVTEDPDSAWLTIVADNTDPVTGLGSYRVEVDRGGLAPGTYAAGIVFDWSGDDSSSGELRVPVIMQVESNLRVDDAGIHYVLLLDEQTGEPLAEDQVEARDGRYRYAFVGVPPGRYLIVAGSDPDNDQVICAASEACGAYLTLDQLQPIVVDDDRTGLDFVTSFEARVDASGAGTEALGNGIVPFER